MQLLLVPALSPLFIGIVRRVKARLQNRVGARVTQPYRDILKLFRKDEVVSADASWIFSSAPYLIFAVSILLGASIPLLSAHLTATVLGDLLTVVYVIALSTFFLALAGMDTGNAFGGFGSSREMTVAALTEGGLIFSLLALAFTAHSSNLFVIAGAISSLSLLAFTPIILAFVAFVIALLAETGRFPFDNPATHLELTMIHEAMILEYSGKKLALMEWAAANKFMLFLALGANLFFPWGLAASASPPALILALGALVFKLLVFCVLVALLESSLAKFRFFRLPDLLFMSFILSLIALSLIV
ncbi:MAG: membrane-bound [NiFe]-hydrogenase-3, subunit D [Candidatus Magasanikbacteria bacterium GW2011_GWA2_56_11]|uniref:Membrane-bound [NiFe]-hydrogenase-3, subunit D n=1 Tax=Candidatus Magasanikbacteria bacterium GW2011_GWA2_56_11 TaxID=1619044 RepID=A0A0G1YGC9_9BACT|nr:MAG: membrane-bound [NiFe]-hydrogenase-3, subunit D [Candidatus Magasanikbacteria bacterium GW2011_GWA2_56_11]